MNAILEELRWKKFPVLNDGFVCVVDAMGSDEAIVRSAKVSYGKDDRECGACGGFGGTEPEEYLNGRPVPGAGGPCTTCNGTGHIRQVKPEDAEKLIRYMMSHRHSTPFETPEVQLLVRVPMDTWRQWIRHRTASVNEYSTRYTEAIDECEVVLPGQWRLQSSSNKQGSSGILEGWPVGWGFHPRAVCTAGSGYRVHREHPADTFFVLGEHETPGECLSRFEVEELSESRLNYKKRLLMGVAREQARKNLPLSNYTEAYWKCDLANIFHFLGLRMEKHAQLEIRSYANVIGEQIIAKLFPIAWQAFLDYRLNALTLSAMEVDAMRLALAALRSEGHLGTPVDYVPASMGKREVAEFAEKLLRLGFAS